MREAVGRIVCPGRSAPAFGRASAVGIALLLASCQYQIAPTYPDAGPGPFVGQVSVMWAPTSTSVSANFTTPQLAGEFGTTPDNCPGTVTGNCCIYSQPQVRLGEDDTGPITVSAGTISVADGTQDLGTMDFAAEGYIPLSSAESNSLAWNPGDTLTVSSSGGNVPAFTGTLIAPPAFAGVSPDLTTTAQIVVHVGADFTIAWTPVDGGTGNVNVEFFDPTGFYANCQAPESAGSVTAPSGTLSSFTSGDNGYVTLSRPLNETVPAGSSTVTLTAEATAVGLANFQ